MLVAGDFSVQFDRATYYGVPNQAVTYMVKPSNPAVSVNEYAYFSWDFDGDGTIDDLTDVPQTTHVYSWSYNNVVRVFATNLDGQVMQATASVQVADNVWSRFATLRPSAPQNLTAVRRSATSSMISWDAADDLSSSWVIQVDDTPGIRYYLETTHDVVIEDIDMVSTAHTIHVRGVANDGTTGNFAQIGILLSGQTTTDDEYNGV